MTTFIADVHLGRLAKSLRLLGFDTRYQNNFTHAEIMAIAVEEARTLLSRNVAFAKNTSIQSFIIYSEDFIEQLKAVVEHFSLKNSLQPFSRCIVCNGLLKTVPKQTILKELKENTAKYYNEFWQCNNCQRIYWQGPHFERMLRLIDQVKG
jgi:uncharacterized protein with PIN domain